MEKLKSLLEHRFIRRFISVFTVITLMLLIGCQESVMDAEDPEPSNDQEAMLKIADEDSSLQSFDEVYNEEDLMEFSLGKVQAEIYPFRVGHKVRMVNRDLNVDVQEDTSYGVLTITYEGVLLIAASYDSGAAKPDTIIQKPFTAVVTRNLIFVKVGNSPRPYQNWRLAAISLPEGGALSSNIDITKITVFLPNGETIVVESPNDYYLSRRNAWWLRWRDIPVIPRHDSVLVRVELFSAYEEEDFVTVTFGKNKFHGNRLKKRFELISSSQAGNGYEKVYEQTFRTHAFPGFFHAVINALPNQVIHDDAAPVESSMWGIPYFVKL
jgi:hypothetical protein